MDRRSFLRRSSLALVGGLVVGDAALEAFERLTHRKVFALGGLPVEPAWDYPYPADQHLKPYLGGTFRPGDHVAIVRRDGSRAEYGIVTDGTTVTFRARTLAVLPDDLVVLARDARTMLGLRA